MVKRSKHRISNRVMILFALLKIGSSRGAQNRQPVTRRCKYNNKKIWPIDITYSSTSIVNIATCTASEKKSFVLCAFYRKTCTA